MSTINMAFSIQPAIVYWVAGQTFSHAGAAAQIATVVAFTTQQTRLLFPISQLLSVGTDVEASLALFDRIFEYLDLPVDIVEAQDPVELRPGELLGEVRLEGVGFRYGENYPWTLHDVDLVVPAGTRTAIVGETGAGKTTLGYLVARLYEPEEGRVTIDGVDVRDASFESLAATVGVVSQETYLFHASVRENLRFARPEASDEEIEAAARTARIHNLIASLPDGLRHGRGRARLPLLRRREAAHRDRPHDPAQPARARARRGDQLAGHAHRARGPGGARPARARDARRSRSRTGSRRFATPIRSSCSTTARSSSGAPTRNCWRAAAATRRCSRTIRRRAEPEPLH